jgi:hypothetical protein
MFTTPVVLKFSPWEPTVARIAWGACALPMGYEHLTPTIEYVVYLSSDANTARDMLQAGRGNFSLDTLHSKGIHMSEGSCGILSQYVRSHKEIEQFVDRGHLSPVKTYDPEELFTDASEKRLIAKYSQAEARWINYSDEGDDEQVTGYG